MATNVGEAVIKLSFDDKDSATKLQDAFKNVGKIAGTAGKFIAGGMIAATSAVSGLAAGSVKAYGEFEQLAGGMQKIFDEMDYKTIEQDALNAYQTMNISASQYMEQLAGVGATFAQTMGDQKGYETAKSGMQSLADYASGTGKDINLLMDKYQAITRSTSSYLSIADQFAGLLPQTTDGFLKQAQEAGYLSDQYTRLSEVPVAEYQEALTKVLSDGVGQMGLAGNTAAETAGTITGSLNASKAAFQNLITGLANPDADLDALIDTALDSVLKVVDNIVPALGQALKGITKFIQKAVPKLLQIIPELLKEVLPDIIQTAAELFTTIMDEIPTITQTLIDTFFGVVQMLIPQIPTIFTAVINGILGFLQTLSNPANLQLLLKTALQLLMAIVQAVPQIIQALSVALPEIISNLVAFFLDPNNIMIIMDAAMQLFLGVVQAVPQIFGALFQAFGSLFGKLWEKIQGMFTQFFGNFGETVKRIFVNAVNGVLQFIENFINGPIDTINGFIDIINSTFGSVGVNLGKINRLKLPRMAQGGVVDSATAALIGEAGKEAVIPLERNTENWTAPLAKALAEQFEQEGISTDGRITVTMNNYINNNLDADEIGQRLMTSIRRAA